MAYSAPVATQDVYHRGFRKNLIERIRRIVINRIKKGPKKSPIHDTPPGYRGGDISQAEYQRVNAEHEAEVNLINKFEEKKKLKSYGEERRRLAEKEAQMRVRQEEIRLNEMRVRERRLAEEKRLRGRH